MTIPLSKRIADLSERLVRLEELGSNADEASALEDLRVELVGTANKLSAPRETGALLIEAGIPVSIPSSLASAKKRSATVLARFQATRKAATLKKAQSWKNLLEEIERASRELTSAATSAWRNYRTQAFSGDSPAAIRARGLARTKENDAALEEYRLLFAQLDRAFDSLPEDIADIEHVRSLGRQLEDAARKFNFDVPDEVRSFLEAVLSVEGAPLELLTPQVQAWLSKHGLYDHYRIRSLGHAR